MFGEILNFLVYVNVTFDCKYLTCMNDYGLETVFNYLEESLKS